MKGTLDGFRVIIEKLEAYIQQADAFSAIITYCQGVCCSCPDIFSVEASGNGENLGPKNEFNTLDALEMHIEIRT
jgi:hypothetical protein